MAEYLKRYDVIRYHPGKANVVVDALSPKSASLVAFMVLKEWQLWEQVVDLNAELKIEGNKVVLSSADFTSWN